MLIKSLKTKCHDRKQNMLDIRSKNFYDLGDKVWSFYEQFNDVKEMVSLKWCVKYLINFNWFYFDLYY